ncbi:MAG: Uma2 family endonuclease [Blastocatellia bacterium]
MVTETLTYFDAVSTMPPDTVVIFQRVSWEEYEELLEQVGEAHGLRISYLDGTLKVMSLSPEHEQFVAFIESMISSVRLRLRINILFFGSMTMRKQKKTKGNEPDACFYVQAAGRIGNRRRLDFTVDPPPDVVLEVDIHHDSTHNDAIYAALGVPEIWRYNGVDMTILHLEDEQYRHAGSSLALPILNGAVLTGYLNRMQHDGEFQAILAFDEWLQTLPQS